MRDFSAGAQWHVKVHYENQVVDIGPFHDSAAAEQWAIHELDDEGYDVEWHTFHMVHPDFAAEFLQDEWGCGPGHKHIKREIIDAAIKAARSAGAYAVEHEEIPWVTAFVDVENENVTVSFDCAFEPHQYQNVCEYCEEDELPKGWTWSVGSRIASENNMVVYDSRRGGNVDPK